MGDILTYRIPNQEIKKLHGHFDEVQNFDDIQGFITTTFTTDKKYHFIEQSEKDTFYYSTNIPICYSQDEYQKLGTIFLNALQQKKLSKAILSRVKSVQIDLNPTDLFIQLCSEYPTAFVYLISSPLFGTWIGATPEVLIQSNGKSAQTMSLAGTLDRNSKENWKEKENEEQQFVTDFIQEQLTSAGIQNLVISAPTEVNAGPVRHLKTTFQFELGPHTAIDIAQKLHPTPAISGFPQYESLQLIQEIELHDRKLYAGMIGFIGNNSTQLFINLRCAEIIHQSAFLYLGGGYTQSSNVHSEWTETENKAKTLLNVMKKQ